ncbi:N-acetyltransferase family protein [Primorskyibacter sp. S187A]|uniref:GNAT family N-acetyltransferase n=1 Tax=Primorskyibacter sp. S187A TaxID=3415130 RepID=UPI003C7AD4BE
MKTALRIEAATAEDAGDIWAILEPVFRAGDTYAIDPDISRDAALAYWLAEHVFIVRIGREIAGTYYIQRNRPGGGAHYCNCGFVTAPGQTGRGIARAMLTDALQRAPTLGFTGMVFNFVVASNTRAVATWEHAGFETVGRVPSAFRQPCGSFADALVMFRKLV